MGSSAPKVTAVPQPETNIYQTVIPQRDFDTASSYVKSLKEQTYGPGGYKEQIYKMTGTPEEMGARAAGIRSREAASYAASIPTRDKFVADNPAYNVLSETSNKIAEDMRQNYAEAVKKVEESKANPAPAWTPPAEPERREETDPWSEPERQSEPEKELKDLPWTSTTLKGQTTSSAGNYNTMLEKMKYAKANNKRFEDVSWNDIGYKDPDNERGGYDIPAGGYG
jgi:hypothetical protein